MATLLYNARFKSIIVVTQLKLSIVKKIFFIFFLLSSGMVFSQEICDNGIDDDLDGLVDLNDTTDCKCEFKTDTTVSNAIASLIPNPSFEARTCCPSNFSQLNCANTWIQASPATSDYFNTCGYASYTPWGAGPPLPIAHGNGFVGYIDGGSSSFVYKEYIGACLLDTMHAGTSYTIQFSMAWSGGKTTIPVAIFGNTVCARLPFTQNGCPTTSTTPGWIFLDSAHVTLDTTRWNTVTLSFIPTADITTISLGPSCVFQPIPVGYSYNMYYLDNLLLNNSSFFNKPLAFVSDSGHYCSKDIILKANFDSIPNSYQWYKEGVAIVNDTNRTYSVPPNDVGDYSVRLFYDSGCIVTAPFTVDSTVIDFDIDSRGSCLTTSTTGQVFVTNHRNGTSPYEFQIDGGSFQSDSTFRNLTPGLHTVVVRDTNTCELTKTIHVDTFPRPVADFETDSACLAQVTTFTDLSTISSGTVTEWSWGLPGTPTTQNTSYTSPTDGSFPITLSVKSDSGCTHDVTKPVIVHPLPTPDFSFSPSEVFTFDTRICFANSSTGAATYNWNFDFSGASGTSILDNPCTVTFPNDKSGTYTVKLVAFTNYGCSDSVEYNVIVLDGLFLFIPNSFSPNDDGINDEFSISSEGIDEFVFIIFNRWGEEIFKTTDLQFTWDGKHQGNLVEVGAYPYTVRVKTDNGFTSEKQGHLNVLR